MSSKDQDIGAEAQEQAVRDWCELHNIVLVYVFEDRMSGVLPLEARVELLAAFGACSTQNCGLLVATNWDRYSRHKHFFTDLERMAEEKDVRLVTVEGGLQENEILRDIKQALASEERRKISERNKRRVSACRVRGQLHGGRPPFGHQLVLGGQVGKRNTVVEIEENSDEQRVICKIIQLRGQGLSYRQICAALDAAQTKCRGNEWKPAYVRRVFLRTENK